jgi:hypothetical protein
MHDACRAANLPPLIFHSEASQSVKNLWSSYQKTFHSDIRGTRLNDALSSGPQSHMNVDVAPTTITGSQVLVNQAVLPLVMQFVRTRNTNGEFCPYLQALQ